jgi:hypothetical protein
VQPACRGPVGGNALVGHAPLRGELGGARSAAVGEVVGGQAALVLQPVDDRCEVGAEAGELVHPGGLGALHQVGADRAHGEDR